MTRVSTSMKNRQDLLSLSMTYLPSTTFESNDSATEPVNSSQVSLETVTSPVIPSPLSETDSDAAIPTKCSQPFPVLDSLSSSDVPATLEGLFAKCAATFRSDRATPLSRTSLETEATVPDVVVDQVVSSPTLRRSQRSRMPKRKMSENQDQRSKRALPHKKVKSKASRPSRVEKKCASGNEGYEWKFEYLNRVTQEANELYYEVYWAPTWVTISDLRGTAALKEARQRVIDHFGRDAWANEERIVGIAQLPDSYM